MHHKTAEAFAGGQSLQVPMVREVLHCYQQSQRVDDPYAYCWFKTVFRFDLTVTTYTIDDASKSLLYPCRVAAPRACWIHAEQPGNITPQVDAALLRAGRRWCPRLADLTEWQDAAYALGHEKSRFAVRDLS